MKKDLTHVAIATQSKKESAKIVAWFKSLHAEDSYVLGNGTNGLYYIDNENEIRHSLKFRLIMELKIFKSLSAAKAWYNRPIIELKPEFDAKLRELGVRTKFVKNLIAYCKRNSINLKNKIEDIQITDSFYHFVHRSFCFSDTTEGYLFWAVVAEGYNLITEVRLQESEVVHE